MKKVAVEDVDDLLNQTFLNFFSTLRSTLNSLNNPFSYILKIARNLVIDYYRRKSKEKFSINLEKTNLAKLQDLKQNEIDKEIEFEDYLEKLLESLSEEEKLILRMKIIEGLSFREISEKLNLKLNTTLSKFNRLLKKIQVTEKNKDL